MAVLNTKYNYLFLAEPHSGSRAVTRALMQHQGSRLIGHYHIRIKELISKEILTFRELKKLIIFSFIRNPFDILATIIASKQCTWEEALKKQKLDRCRFYYHADEVDHRLVFEFGLQKELDDFCKLMKMPTLSLGKNIERTVGKREYSTYFNPEDVRVISTLVPEVKRYKYA